MSSPKPQAKNNNGFFKKLPEMSVISTYEKIDWRQKSRSKHYTCATILVLSSGLAEWTILSTGGDSSMQTLFDRIAFRLKRSFAFLKLDCMYNNTFKLDLQVTRTNDTCR